jgi:phospholipid transport system substrate-binding protein
LTAQEKAENAQLKREIITGTFDIRELSRLALDKHWGARSATEQNQFVALMTDLLEKKGILSKEQSRTRGKKYVVKYLGDTYLDSAKSRAKTRTSIHVPKEDVNVSIDYKLVKAGSGWKIFDVIVDDASLVDNYKYQFNSIITKHGYPELIARINKKLNEMDKS